MVDAAHRLPLATNPVISQGCSQAQHNTTVTHITPTKLAQQQKGHYAEGGVDRSTLTERPGYIADICSTRSGYPKGARVFGVPQPMGYPERLCGVLPDTLIDRVHRCMHRTGPDKEMRT